MEAVMAAKSTEIRTTTTKELSDVCQLLIHTNERKEDTEMIKAFKKVLVCTLAAALTLGTAATAGAATASPATSVTAVAASNVKASNGAKVDTNKNGTATVKAVKKTNSKSVTVASTVKVNGVSYKVTVIGAKAFANAKKATKITLPATVKTISKNAFKGAKKVKTITLKGKKSITVKKGAFNGVNTKKVTIKVNKKMSKKELKKLKKALKKAGFKGKVTK